MSDQVFESSALERYIGPLLASGSCAFMTFGGMVFVMKLGNWLVGIPVIGLAVICGAKVIRTFGKFGAVVAHAKGLTITQGGIRYEFGWRDIDKCAVMRWRLGSGPLYRLTFSSSPLVTYFVPGTRRVAPLELSEPYYEGMVDFISKNMAGAQGGGAI